MLIYVHAVNQKTKKLVQGDALPLKKRSIVKRLLHIFQRVYPT